jgi:hypothetical protein
VNADLTRPRRVLDGDRVMRVDWLPGSDRLRGCCHCGAETEAEDPVAMWEWLLAHPDHPTGDGRASPHPAELPPPPAHLVTNAGRLRRAPALA